MTSVENVRFQLRNGTATQWANANTVLLAGEPGFDTTNKILKIGDGANLWSALQSFTPGPTGGSSVSGSGVVNINPTTRTIYGGNNAGTTALDSINLGSGAGESGQQQSSLAIGFQAGRNNQGRNSISLGFQAGINNQGQTSIAIGVGAGSSGQNQLCIAIGSEAGAFNQSTNSVAIGTNAGRGNQSTNSVAIGTDAGGFNQSTNCVAIGNLAGGYGQENNCIAIGNKAGSIQAYTGTFPFGAVTITSQAANTIILNATGNNLNGVTGQTGSLYIAPIRSDTTQTLPLCYNPTTFEIVRGGTATSILDPVTKAIYIGDQANRGSTGCINLGRLTGLSPPGATAQGNNSIAIGEDAGDSQGSNAVSIGTFASGGFGSVSLGFEAGRTNQKPYGVAIGYDAGKRNQGLRSIAIGYNAGLGTTNPQADNTIILNATVNELSGVSGQTGSCYINPIRSLSGASTANQGYSVLYNPVTKELYIA